MRYDSAVVSPFLLRGAAILAVYLVVAGVCTRPLLELRETHVAGGAGDPVLNASILWWNATTIPFSEQWWNPPYFHLTKGVSAFTENLVGVSPISTPLYRLTRNPVTTYNLTLFLTWPLSAFAVYLLVRFLVHRDDAAFLAGLAYGFTPYRTAEMGHIQMVASFWMPIALLGLHGFIERRRPVWLVVFGAGWLLQSLANGYLMLFGAVLIALWVAFFCSARNEWRAAGGILAAWVVASLPLVPVMLRYREVHEYYGLRRDLSDVISYSVPAAGWLEVTDFVWFWRHVLPDGKDDLFPGVTAVIVVLSAAIVSVRRSNRDRLSSGARLLLIGAVAITAISVAVIVYTIFAGPWRVDVGPVAMRVSDIDRALIVAVLFGGLLLFLAPGLRDALRRRSVFVFYTAGVIAMGVLSCGPVISVGNAIVLDATPYSWLMNVPGFRELRVPSRFWMLGVLCLAVAAGLGFARLHLSRQSTRIVLLLSISAGLLLDGWMRDMPMAAAPERRAKVERRDLTLPILELPLGPQWDAAATFRSIGHRRGVFNGVSGYDPLHYQVLQEGLNEQRPEILRALSSFGSFDVVVNEDAESERQWTRYVAAFPGAARVSGDGVHTLYRVPAGSPEPSVGPSLPVRHAHASAGDAMPVADGRRETAWVDAPQRPGQWVAVDLGGVREIGGVTHVLGEHAQEFPRHLAIDLSVDGVNWEQVWHVRAVGHAFRAAVVAPRDAVMRFTFSPRAARYVRLRQMARHPYTWRVTEIEIHAPSQ